jgi:hypothetical protein
MIELLVIGFLIDDIFLSNIILYFQDLHQQMKEIERNYRHLLMIQDSNN